MMELLPAAAVVALLKAPEPVTNPTPHNRARIAIETAESLGDPYLRQVPLPRIPVSRKLRSTQYPKDTFPAKLTVKPQRITHRAAARLNGPAARLTRRTHVFRQLGNIPVQ